MLVICIIMDHPLHHVVVYFAYKVLLACTQSSKTGVAVGGVGWGMGTESNSKSEAESGS